MAIGGKSQRKNGFKFLMRIPEADVILQDGVSSNNATRALLASALT